MDVPHRRKRLFFDFIDRLYLNSKLPKGIKLVFLNFQSDWPDLSGYIIDGLIENTVNDGIFTVVDRQNLALIQQEMNFQLSGEVSDGSAQAIGKLLGAQTIVSGAVSQLGGAYRLRVRAIEVETAEIQGQFNHDISADSRIAALTVNSGDQTSLATGSLKNTVPQSGPTAQTGVPTLNPASSPSPSTAAPTNRGASVSYERFTALRRLEFRFPRTNGVALFTRAFRGQICSRFSCRG